MRSHGFRNTGHDLRGFAIDLDSFLDSSELFDGVQVTETGEDDCMLIAQCQVRDGISLGRAKDEVCRIWERSLRYREFSDYSIDESPVGFTFHFVILLLGRQDSLHRAEPSLAGRSSAKLEGHGADGRRAEPAQKHE